MPEGVGLYVIKSFRYQSIHMQILCGREWQVSSRATKYLESFWSIVCGKLFIGYHYFDCRLLSVMFLEWNFLFEFVVESGLIYNLTMFRYIKLEESKYIIVSVIFIKKRI